MSTWIKFYEAAFLHRHHSDRYERIIPLKNGTPLRVSRLGSLTVGLFRDYDEVAIVDLRPRHVVLSLSDGLVTKDGVRVDGTINFSAKIKDFAALILRLVPNVSEEEKLMNSHLSKGIKSYISSKDWIELHILNESASQLLKENITNQLLGADICFEIIDITGVNFTPTDEEFANTLEKIRKNKESEKLEIEKLKSSQERINLENDMEAMKISKDTELGLAKQKQLNEIDQQKLLQETVRKKTEHEELLRQKKDEVNFENETFLARNKIIKENPDILALINPDLYEKIKLAELKLKLETESQNRKLLEQLVLKQTDNKLARAQGQIEIMSALASTRLDIDAKHLFQDNSSDDEIKKLKNEIEQLKNQDRSPAEEAGDVGSEEK